jgi:hypothetical protein
MDDLVVESGEDIEAEGWSRQWRVVEGSERKGGEDRRGSGL